MTDINSVNMEMEKLEELAKKMGFKTYREFKNQQDKDKMKYFRVASQTPEVYKFISWLMKDYRVGVRFSSMKEGSYWRFSLGNRFGLIDYYLFIGMWGINVGHVWFFKDIWGQTSLTIRKLERFKKYEISDLESIRKICNEYGIEGYMG